MRSEQPRLSFREDGDDLIVSLEATANNSPHVLWTHVVVLCSKVIPTGGRVDDAPPQTTISLQYCVIQNRSRFVRSQKAVDVTWCLPGRKRGSERYEVHVG